jgi:cellulose synthase operon protein C
MLTVVAVLLAQLTSPPVESEEQNFRREILSMEAAYWSALESGALRLPTWGSNQEQEIAAQPRALIDACEHFISAWPQSARRGDVRFKAAHIAYQYSHLDQSVGVLTELVLTYPEGVLSRPMSGESSLCAFAADLVLDVYRVRDDHQKLNISARQFAASRCAAKNRRLAKELREYEVRSTYLLARDQKEDILRADAYVHFAADFPASELAEMALFNASSDYRQEGLAEKANATCKRLLATYPRSEFAAQARQAMASPR